MAGFLAGFRAGSEARSPADRRLVPAVALSVWNLFVWGGRLRNLIAEPGDLLDANRWSLAGSILFCALAVATLVTLTLDRSRTDIPAITMAAVGIAVWSYRAVVILGRDYSVGFLIVHTVLALVTIVLGLVVIRSRAAFGAAVPIRS